MKKVGLVLCLLMILVGATVSTSVAAQEGNQVSAEQQIPTVNINTASVAELKSLPGIGNVTAQRILDYREKIQSFSNTSQLMDVKGIGKKSFEKIRELVSVK